MRQALIVLAAGMLLTACGTAPGPQPLDPAKGSGPGGQTQSGPAKPQAQPGSGTQPGSSQASAQAPSAPVDEKVAELKAKYDKNPNDEAVKKELASATLENANYYMYSSPLPPNQKYPKALAMYREVTRLDPGNATAQESIQIIEDIYRSLGKPVPTV